MYGKGMKYLATLSVTGFILALVVSQSWPAIKKGIEERRQQAAEQAKLERQVANAEVQVANAVANPEGFKNAVDVWGTPLNFTTHGTAIVALKVTSAGPDRMLDTDDDIFAETTSFTMSGLGKKVGHGVGEFGQGALSGLKDSIMERWNGKD